MCDRILADLNATCDECKEMYGDALRRTDVLLGADDDGVKEALEFACGEKGGNIRNILSFIDDATEDAVLVELSVLATEKGADRQVLHPDVAYDAPHETLYSVFIALQDVTQDMGPTLFVLNSHDKRTHDQLPKTKWTEKEFDVLRTKTCAEALLKKGDAVLYNADIPPRWREHARTTSFVDAHLFKTSNTRRTNQKKQRVFMEHPRGRVPQAVYGERVSLRGTVNVCRACCFSFSCVFNKYLINKNTRTVFARC